MTRRYLLTLAAGLVVVAASAARAADATLAAMRWRRRVLLIASPGADHPATAEQRRMVSAWGGGASDRDLSVVEIVGQHVVGAADAATDLRRHFGLVPKAWQVLLIGKDGHVALRSAKPIPASALQAAIDAMPMRRAGDR